MNHSHTFGWAVAPWMHCLYSRTATQLFMSVVILSHHSESCSCLSSGWSPSENENVFLELWAVSFLNKLDCCSNKVWPQPAAMLLNQNNCDIYISPSIFHYSPDLTAVLSVFSYNNSLSISVGLITLPCCPLVYLTLCLWRGALLSSWLASALTAWAESFPALYLSGESSHQMTSKLHKQSCVLQRLPYISSCQG